MFGMDDDVPLHEHNLEVRRLQSRIRELEAERDAAEEAARIASEDNLSLYEPLLRRERDRAESAEARLARAVELLRRRGHHPRCGITDSATMRCTCGLADVLAKHEPRQEDGTPDSDAPRDAYETDGCKGS